MEGVFLDNPKFPELNQKINAIAEDKGVTNSAIAIAWLLRHPAHMQPIIGSTSPQQVKDSCQASGVTLTRQEWYQIYLAAGNKLPAKSRSPLKNLVRKQLKKLTNLYGKLQRN
jgi:predicted oxidoreductase